MNRLNLRIFFTLCFGLIAILNGYSQNKVVTILTNIKANIKNTDFLSYHSTYRMTNPNLEDSVTKYTSTVWLDRTPSDSIFGAYFHLKGEDRSGEVDYFYDGQYSYAIRHKKEKITIYQPQKYPNNPNNPAKRLAVLLPFIDLLVDENIMQTLLKENPSTNLRSSKDNANWLITLKYPTNEYGQQLTQTLVIDKSSNNIKKISKLLKWRGTLFKTKITINNYIRDKKSISNKVFISKSYEHYTQTQYKKPKEKKNNPYKKLIGRLAYDFNYKSFDGENISLDRYKGKIILLDFWESWCGHCIMNMPELNKLQKKWEDKLVIIGVVTQNKKQVDRFIKKNQLVYQNIFADKTILENYNVSNRPTYYLIDSNSKILEVSTGDLQTIKTKIKEVIK